MYSCFRMNDVSRRLYRHWFEGDIIHDTPQELADKTKTQPRALRKTQRDIERREMARLSKKFKR